MSEVEVKLGDDGVWYCRHYIKQSRITGKKLRPFRKFPGARNEEEALAMAGEWLAADYGVFAEDGLSPLFGDLLKRYIAVLEAANRAPNSIRTYRTLESRYVSPYLGRAPIDKITTARLEDLFIDLHARVEDGGAGLSPATVAGLRNFLSGAFKWMQARGYVAHNPVKETMKIQLDEREPGYLDEDEVAELYAFIDAIAADGSHRPGRTVARETAMAVRIALATGMRCGEVLALRRKDFDPDRRTLRVSGTVIETPDGPDRQESPKAKSSRRTVKVDGATADAIRAHLAWQDEAGRVAKEKPVCGGNRGFMRPTNVSSRFGGWARSIGLPEGTRFHTLRHTHATLLLHEGESVKTIAGRLGHAKVSTTTDIYTHSIQGADESAAEAWGRIGRS